jgi:hypothetical protein
MSPSLTRTAALAALLWVPAWVAAWPHARTEALGKCGRAPAAAAKACCGAHDAAVSAAPEPGERCLLCDLAAGGVESASAPAASFLSTSDAGEPVSPASTPETAPLTSLPLATGPPSAI